MYEKNTARCSQVIYPNGVGSIFTGVDNKSYIVAGLDGWFKALSEKERQKYKNRRIDLSEFIVREPRLEEKLGVSHFRLAPDFRVNSWGQEIPNTYLRIPVLRFPQWYHCKFCGLMKYFPLTFTKTKMCENCEEDSFFNKLMQIQIIALCEHGHIQDFPWREWCHREHNPTCEEQLFYKTYGSSMLSGQYIECECGKRRSLKGINKANYAETHLTRYLSKDEGFYLCRGNRPWLDETDNTSCDRHLRGNHLHATNIWFADIESSVYLPEKQQDKLNRLNEFLNSTQVKEKLKQLESLSSTDRVTALRAIYTENLKNFSDDEIAECIEGEKNLDKRDIREEFEGFGNDKNLLEKIRKLARTKNKSEQEFRLAEYQTLREEQESDEMICREAEITSDYLLLQNNFSRIMQVHRLRETKVLAGFNRVWSHIPMTGEDKRKLLRRGSNSNIDSHNETKNLTEMNDWLPASIVYGEGIFVEFDNEKLKAWEEYNRDRFREYLKPLKNAYHHRLKSKTSSESENDFRRNESVPPRFILIHTLAHLIIRELTFSSGYHAAALRERLYVSNEKDNEMNGFLIYTADGDSEGTLGGLVNMGHPSNFETLLDNALARAEWCRANPHCSEMAKNGGRGPGSGNLAACHECVLLPNTSCEEFNKFLDRHLINEFFGVS